MHNTKDILTLKKDELTTLATGLSLALDTAKVGVWNWDIETNTTIWNDRMFKIYGLNKKVPIPYDDWLNILVPDDRAKVEASIQRVFSDKTKDDIQFRIVKPDKSIGCIEASLDVICNDAGKVLRVVGVNIDITETSNTTQEIKELNERMELALLGNKDGIWELNLIDNSVYFSPKWKDMVGYEDHELPNLLETWEKRVHPDDLENVWILIQEHIDGKSEYFEATHRLKHKDGTWVWILARGKAIYDEDGNAVRMAGTHHDITEKKEAEILSRESQIRYKSLIKQSPNAMEIYDINGVQREVNRAHEKLWGVPKSKTLNRFNILTDEKFKESGLLPYVNKAYQGEAVEIPPYDFSPAISTNVTDGVGRLRTVRTFIFPIKDDLNKVMEIVVTHTDITDKKEAELQLRQSAHVFESTTEGVMITDIDSNIIDVNNAFSDITEYEKSEVIGKTPSILKSGRHNHSFYKFMWESILSAGTWKGEIWNRRKNGEVYPQWLNISSVKNEFGEIENYIAVFSDISSLKETESKLDFLAHHDHLTELPNRTLLKARLEHSLSMAKQNKTQTGIIFMDIDNFKNINDSYGHTLGDTLLIAVAKRINKIMREEDTLARIGGDEFIIVMNDVKSPEHVTHVIQNIMEEFGEPVVIDEKEFWITLSMGVSIAPDDGISAETLIKNSDTAMYVAKDDGKNTFKFYNDKMGATSFERIVFENALKTAIQDNQFEVYYQPQEDLTNNKIVGLEALIRWHHPTEGIVSPGLFIPIAEDTKMILQIGEFVLKQACKDIKKWHQEGLHKGYVSINVSGVQLEYSDFSNILKSVLTQYDIDPSMIKIEVTESIIMKNPERWIAILEEIKRIGVSISIDDFGTGYSSLSYLRSLPADTLKIDQSFIQDTPDKNDACAIINAIINMAESLGLDTIAEGVETVEQRDHLIEQGCNYAQGYLLSRPMSGSDMYSWLKQNQ